MGTVWLVGRPAVAAGGAAAPGGQGREGAGLQTVLLEVVWEADGQGVLAMA